ncbi:tryptophan halogenase family protein [Neptunicella marina]|uniref:Tryptophan 7-halogenase n=1 Tax=Neptunicella marina TaxID=2125989 RepID=A0A8J6ISP3_9ALTE|nr:tryptophan halogenase family protein [Neptunicella marina]MBC3765709.1 tryptophan 7-halogenase [Neptunicella marina]
MTQQSNNIQQFLIVGGGTAGWLAVATLSNILQNADCQITLVESNDIGTIGVGEATIPPLLDAIRALGIDEADFIRKTQATFKWGIQFRDWLQKGSDYFHPFGALGRRIDGHEFYQVWLKCRAEGDNTPLMAHSVEAELCTQQRFFEPFNAANTPLASAQYALHLDSGLVANYLRDFAIARGVQRIEGTVSQVHQHQNGDIASVSLIDGQQLSAQFFIDCSGFRGLLIEQTLNAGYHDWSAYLPCNRAVTVQSQNVHDALPYTIATARESGWTWQIPLQHRTGNGYVFCDQFCDDQTATDTLLNAVEGEVISTPRIIPFTTGMRKQCWFKNCLALGLAQGFLEPLESTAIHLVSKTLALFVRYFPSLSDNQFLQQEFNRKVELDYLEIRDFLILHYCTTKRSDTAFWQHCANMPIPDSLQYKIELFKQAGNLVHQDEALFQSSSWYAIFTGMQVFPQRYNPTLDALNSQKLQQSLAAGANAIKQAVSKQPAHMEFIRQYCAAPNPG